MPDGMMRGLVLGQETVDTVLVRMATEDEARQLAALPCGQQVGVAPVAKAGMPPLQDVVGGAVYARGVDGQFYEVGVVTDLCLERDAFDVTSMMSAGHTRVMLPGLARVRGSFVWTGGHLR